MSALNGDGSDWNQTSDYASYVQEALKRGLTVAACKQSNVRAAKDRELEIAKLRSRLKNIDRLAPSEAIQIYTRLSKLFPTDKQYAQRLRELQNADTQIKWGSHRIAYKKLSRDPNSYIGERVFYRGQVAQVMEDGDDVVLRINVTRGPYGIWTDTIYVDYHKRSPSEQRILDQDIVTFWGEFLGIHSYQAIFGKSPHA